MTVSAQSPQALTLAFSQPTVELEGRYVAITNGLLNLLDIDLDTEILNLMRQTVPQEVRQFGFPEEYLQLDPTFDSAAFATRGNTLQLDFKASAPATVDVARKVMGLLLSQE